MLNPKFDDRNSIFVSPRAFDDLRWIPEDPNDPDSPVALISDVRLLLNSERIINVLGEDVYRSLINSMVPKKSPYQDSNLPDDALFNVKPRHCQEHSEIRAWSQFLISKMSDLKTTVEKAAAEKAAAEKVAAEKATTEGTAVVDS